MKDETTTDELHRMILFGVNHTALLYNRERLEDPKKYNFRYQWDHYWFQARRTKEPAFSRYIFKLSHQSKNFFSNRTLVMKAILRDLCFGKFSVDELSGSVDLESIHKKNKEGNYNPRHTRRRVNEELRDLVYKEGRTEEDERKVKYGTAFRLDQNGSEVFPEEAKRMWEAEKATQPTDSVSLMKDSIPISLKEIYPERWRDHKDLQKEMLRILGTFGTDISSEKYYNALYDEIRSFTEYFVILSNHINSICEIFWFMKKSEDKRQKLMMSKQKLELQSSEITDSLSLMRSAGWSEEKIAELLLPVPGGLIRYGFADLALMLVREILSFKLEDDNKAAFSLEFVALLREIRQFAAMLQLSRQAVSKLKSAKREYVYTLLLIRHAEALSLNGYREEAVKLLEEVYSTRKVHTGDYLPYTSVLKAHQMYLHTEKEPEVEKLIVPVPFSLLVNLSMATWRVGEYCLCKRYLETLQVECKEYLDREDKLEDFLTFSQMYNDVIFKCDEK